MSSTADQVREILDWLERHGTKRNREEMARYGIVTPKAFGVSVAGLKQLGRRCDRGAGGARSS